MLRGIDFYFLVKRMRDYQKIFFKTRDRRVMYRCIELEKQVDNAIEAYINGDVVS
ncbi:MAG: hypothetical protein II948_03165 [Synergistaceae bacterium]|nr:hypothetical protein [Synergistaceae bacterium]MBQ4419148.1 hypothetical protein [Synergistaceae bacterium]MBQ7570091.1 hypothetical protein [Synergistaceae bacterium]MBQ9897528.1 hypothetical protein [Synergistaceae bacterium]MBR0096426.1 hypothetical protein [Synergistaceae bacterium]